MMKTKLFSCYAIALFTFMESAIADETACEKTKLTAEVMSVVDMSSTVQFPVVSDSGQLVGLKSYTAEKFKVNLRGEDGANLVLIMNRRPTTNHVVAEVDICPATNIGRLERLNDE